MSEKQNPAEFASQITDQELNSLRVVITGLVLGGSMFLLVIFILFFTINPIPDAADTSLVTLLTYLVLGFTVASIPLSGMVFRTSLKKKSPDDKPFQVIMSAYIARFAVLEGATFFGLVSLMLAVHNGAISLNTLYWINVLPLLILFFYYFAEFPRRETLQNIYHEYMY